MRHLTSIFLILFLIVTNTLSASNNEKDDKKPKKEKKLPTNIEAIEHNFMLRPKYSMQSTWLDVVDKSRTNNPITYRPNVLGTAGGKIKIKGFSASYMHKLPTDTAFGSTEYRNIDIDIQTRIVGFNFYFLNYNGFYLENPEAYYPFWENSTGYKPKFEDLQIFSAGAQVHFVFTNKFSINAAFNQTERQKESAGSFMLMISDRYTQYRSEEPLYHPSHIPKYNSQSLKRNFAYGRGVFNTTYFALGMGRSWIKGKFNFTPILLAGAGVQLQLYNNTTNTDLSVRKDNKGLRLPLYFNYKNAMGYNGDNFFVLLTHSLELERISFKDVRFNTYFFNIEGSIGIRF